MNFVTSNPIKVKRVRSKRVVTGDMVSARLTLAYQSNDYDGFLNWLERATPFMDSDALEYVAQYVY